MAPLPRALRLAVWAAALAFVAHLALVPLAETDLFFHLKIGQLILERHSIPFQNLFSFTYPNHADPDLSWAFQVLVALFYRAGGFTAIVLLKSALIVAAAALVGRAAVRAGAGTGAAALAVVFAAAAAEPRMVERPHLITFVGVGVLQLALADYENGKKRALWIWASIVIVWANFHAGVFFAPLVLLLYGIGAFLDGKRDPRPLFAAAISGVAMFFTPAGKMLPGYLLWHTGLGSTRDIDEFRRADPFNDPWLFILGAAIVVIALVLRRKIGARRILPLLVVWLLAWRSVRFVAEWALLAAPAIALGLDALARGAVSLAHHPRRWRAAAAGALAASLLALVAAARRGQPFDLGLAADAVPFDAIDFVTKNNLRDRLYVDLDVGCYLLWEGWPRWQVFQDARLPAYPDEFHRALDETPLAPAAFDALLARYHVDAALLGDPDVNMRSGSFDPETWALLYRSDDALVFARRLPRFADAIARFEIPLRVTFRFQGGSKLEAIRRPPPDSKIAACEWQRRLGAALDGLGTVEDFARALDARALALAGGCLGPDEEAETRYRLGARAQLAGRIADAVAEYDRALALRPQDPRALANRGFARAAAAAPATGLTGLAGLAGLADLAGARDDLARALALDPARADVRKELMRLNQVLKAD